MDDVVNLGNLKRGHGAGLLVGRSINRVALQDGFSRYSWRILPMAGEG